MVDLVGIEPTTSSMPWKRAPSCATGPLPKSLLFSLTGMYSSNERCRAASNKEGYFSISWNQRLRFSSCI